MEFSPRLLSRVSRRLGLALEKARKRVTRGNTVESVAAAYLEFAVSSPALYEVMFSLSLSVPFDDAATPPELRFAFSQLLELFQGQSSKPEVLSELFWASLHGIAELTRTKRFPRSRQKERVRALVEIFTFPSDETPAFHPQRGSSTGVVTLSIAGGQMRSRSTLRRRQRRRV